MSSTRIPALAVSLISLAALALVALAPGGSARAQMMQSPPGATPASVPWKDRLTLKAPNGVGLAEIKGYDTWQTVAVSETDESLKVILANPAMIGAYRSGVPGNGKPFPERSAIVKIEWAKTPMERSPYPVREPGALKSIAMIEKDSKRFGSSSGWGYGQFFYDEPSKSIRPIAGDASFNNVCYGCHTLVKSTDYIYTRYPLR